MADSVDRVFVHALNTVKRLPRTGSARPPDADRLRLYGLYKQSMEGDVEGTMAKPDDKSAADGDSISELEKWESWRSNTGLSQTEAKRLYISTLIETMQSYATTTSESRELVAELEFVWNQIKSNPVSSHSSPSGLVKTRAHRQTRGEQHRAPTPGSRQLSRDGLRILDPFSDNAGDEDALNSDVEFGDVPIYGERGVLDSTNSKAFRSSRSAKGTIELALMRMTVEIAALREQMEAKSFTTSDIRNKAGAWAFRALRALLQHVLIDATLLTLFILWAKRSRDPLISNGYRLMSIWFREKLRTLRRSRGSVPKITG